MKPDFHTSHHREIPPMQEAFQRGRTPSVADLVDQYARFNSMLVERMNRMVLDALDPVIAQESRRPEKHHHLEPECGDPCRHDPCHCQCCIGDADLVVYARVGDRRVVPIQITNERRRERQVNLQLSDWTTRSGKKTAVKTQLLQPAQFTLAACAEQDVVLVVDAAQVDPDNSPNPDQGRLPDVEDCQVLYADLRVEGCEIHPVRIALALLPRDCFPYEIHCSCGCCHH